ncbi:MAG: hypothetical protein LBR79_01985 [Oscillospiraceae bacterium]|jgi:hypothetical protein|nr:hypothetical protein [Oscillospiraceae bacterium]
MKNKGIIENNQDINNEVNESDAEKVSGIEKVYEKDSEKVSGGSPKCHICGSTAGSMRTSDGLCGNCQGKGYGCCADCGEIKKLTSYGRCSQCETHYGHSYPRRS